jgi:predicted kinase
VTGVAILLPDPVLVVLVGAAGAGKSTFATRHFTPAEILSSDALRAAVSGDEADQQSTRTAFSILHREVVRRLAVGRLVVVDATNVERYARRALVARARLAGVPAIAIVLALPAAIVHGRNAGRLGRVVDPAIVDRHLGRLAVALGAGGIADEGFAAVHILGSVAEVDRVAVERHRTAGSREGSVVVRPRRSPRR